MTVATLEATAEKRRIELMPGGQSEFFKDDARYTGLFGGVGGSKTFSGLHKAFLFADEYPGARILCTEPRFRLVKQILIPTIRQEFGSVEGSAWTLNKQDFEITFYNGSVIILSSALLMAPQMLSGLFLAAFWMDEVAVGDQEPTFKILQARLRQPGNFPYQGWVTGTPKGMNWVYHTWGPNHKKAYSPHHVRTQDNPHLPHGYYEDLLESYGDTPFARQELFGEFVAYQGLIYVMFSTARHVCEPPARGEFERVVAGVDFSGGVSPSVIEVFGRLPSRRCCGIDEFYRRACPIDALVEAAGKLQAEHGISTFYCDPSGKEEMETMAAAGLPVSPAPVRDVNLGIKLVSALYSNDALTLSSRQVQLIAENYMYQWKEHRVHEGQFLDEPVKENDHCEDAKRYALTALVEPPGTRPLIIPTSIN
ncbi:MAG: hypothetical protein AMJ38_03130 [Dehalococcoidia bacterium DG_22]|nr:MAG: hypothetical protein AMJ38_03130 [Dehalococcoidia bacterium DG_22]